MNAKSNTGMSAGQIARFLGVCTLAVATICMTLPAPEALAAPAPELLAQAYPPPPAYPAPGYGQPGYGQPPPGYGPPPGMPPPGYNDVQQGALDGRTDAPNQLSGTLWFFAGFFLSWIGIILGYVLTPSPDGARLVGKSPAYVGAYTDSYQSAGRSYQGIHAVYGCITSGILWILFIVIDWVLVGSFLFF
ncbi:MAG TPA: hypothetical protein VMB50_00415 [Myxococcales bacterium]|nr:hypothetical protein [Myxococcales bacterium]